MKIEDEEHFLSFIDNHLIILMLQADIVVTIIDKIIGVVESNHFPIKVLIID